MVHFSPFAEAVFNDASRRAQKKELFAGACKLKDAFCPNGSKVGPENWFIVKWVSRQLA